MRIYECILETLSAEGTVQVAILNLTTARININIVVDIFMKSLPVSGNKGVKYCQHYSLEDGGGL